MFNVERTAQQAIEKLEKDDPRPRQLFSSASLQWIGSDRGGIRCLHIEAEQDEAASIRNLEMPIVPLNNIFRIISQNMTGEADSFHACRLKILQIRTIRIDQNDTVVKLEKLQGHKLLHFAWKRLAAF